MTKAKTEPPFTEPVPVLGKRLLGLGRDASYAAARGVIPTKPPDAPTRVSPRNFRPTLIVGMSRNHRRKKQPRRGCHPRTGPRRWSIVTMQRILSPLGTRRKPEPATSSSSGTAFDGGWRRWWTSERQRCNSDWEGLIAGAETALRRFRAVHGGRSS
jgi:hypothetical protein